MKKHPMLACASALLLGVVGCMNAEQPDAVADAEPAAATADAAPAAPAEPAPAAQQPPAPPAAAQAPAEKPKFYPPIRGQAELGYTKPATKRAGKEIHSTFKVKNMSATGSIAGLRVDENWYDKAGNPVTGDTFRYRKPLLPGEVIEITLRTPVNPTMDRNSYNFTHANGTIKTTLVPKLP
jgi:hypothetical protein